MARPNDPAEQRVAEVVKRSHQRTDGLLDRALEMISSTLDPFGQLEDEFEEVGDLEPDDLHPLRDRHPR